MDGLEQYLALRDGVTVPLQNMANAADALAESQEEAAIALGKLEAHMDSLGSKASKTGSILGTIKSGFQSAVGQFAMGNVVGNVFMRVADAAARLPGEIMDASDAYAGMMARLNLVTGSAEEAVRMNTMIYQSALKARGSYDGMANAVSKIAMTAKEAFPDPKEVVPFVEGIQKLFAIGGTGVVEQKNAMLQLQQGLGSGRLQGDEFRSIAEAAPLIEQMAAKHLGVTQGELKNLSSQGLVTAEVLKEAILSNLDEINADFAKMPVTWEQTWQNMGTVATYSFAPVFDTLSKMANSDATKQLISAFTAVMPIIAAIISSAVSGMAAAVNGVVSALNYLSEIGQAVFIALGNALNNPVIFGALAGMAAYLTVINGQMLITAARQQLMAMWTAITTTATAAWTAVTHAQAVAAAILNAVINANPLVRFAQLVFIVVTAFVAWMAATKGVREVVAEAFSTIAGLAETVLNGIIDMINGVINGINKITAGINRLTGSHISVIATVDYRAKDWAGKTKRFVQDFDISQTMKAFAPGAEISGGILGGNEEGPAAKETAENTKGLLDAMDIMDEDIKFFQDMAEREAINRYTTASVNINLQNTNNVSNDVDVDGMITRLVDQLSEAELAGAEAVHI